MKVCHSVLFIVALAPVILAGVLNDERSHEEKSVWSNLREKLNELTGIGGVPHVGGGVEVTPHSYPHQVLLDLYGTMCGGSLISPEWVLTAAHCINKKSKAMIQLGTHYREQPEKSSRQYIKAAELIMEENYTTNDTDIALIKLERPAQLNQYVQTIRLPRRSQQGRNLAGTRAEMIGWGGYSDVEKGVSKFLRRAETRVMDNKVCAKSYGAGIKDWRICSDGSNRKTICGGDSGGPLLMTEEDGKRTVIGIASFGNAAGCEINSPCVFTRVDVWLDWIHRKTGIPIRN